MSDFNGGEIPKYFIWRTERSEAVFIVNDLVEERNYVMILKKDLVALLSGFILSFADTDLRFRNVALTN